MIESSLVICRHDELFRLYHDLLLKSVRHIYSAEQIADAIAHMAVYTTQIAMLFVDEYAFDEVELFLYIQKRTTRFLSTRIFLLTCEPETYRMMVGERDMICDLLNQNPLQIIELILR